MKTCPKCGNAHNLSGIFCSRKCANSRGTRSEEFKKSVSEKLSGRKLSEERKLKTTGELNGSWKGGVTTKPKECLHCNTFYIGQPKTKYCSTQCWKKYCDSKKTEKQLYRSECKFKFNVYHYPNEFDLELIEEYGWYSAKNRGNNQNGVQLDHRYSVNDGFKNNIDPKIISHPANCEIMCNFDNQRKSSKSSISLQSLFELIKKWDEKYNKIVGSNPTLHSKVFL